MWESIGVLVSAYGVYRLGRRLFARSGAGERRLLFRLRQLPTSAIGEVEAGREVKVAGRVRLLGGSVVAPFSGVACAAYTATVREGCDGQGMILASDEQRADFMLEDESGKALVRVEGAFLLLYPTCLRQISLFGDADPKVAAFIERHRTSAGGAVGGTALYAEGALRAGDFAQVLGVAAEEVADAEAPQTYRVPATKIVIRATSPAELIISSYSPHAIKILRLPARKLDQGALDALTTF